LLNTLDGYTLEWGTDYLADKKKKPEFDQIMKGLEEIFGDPNDKEEAVKELEILKQQEDFEEFICHFRSLSTRIKASEKVKRNWFLKCLDTQTRKQMETQTHLQSEEFIKRTKIAYKCNKRNRRDEQKKYQFNPIKNPKTENNTEKETPTKTSSTRPKCFHCN
jgi:Ty3 transposon capsid-like protein